MSVCSTHWSHAQKNVVKTTPVPKVCIFALFESYVSEHTEEDADTLSLCSRSTKYSSPTEVRLLAESSKPPRSLVCNICEVPGNVILLCLRLLLSDQKIGISTVAVYSDADMNAMHVKMADEAIRLGPASATESYLRGEHILEVAKETGAQAIHPGLALTTGRTNCI